MNKTLKFKIKDHIQSIGIVGNTSNKNTTTKRHNTHQRNWTKKEEEEGNVLTHAYQQDEFTSNKKLSSRPIREIRKRMKNVKYFWVENCHIFYGIR